MPPEHGARPSPEHRLSRAFEASFSYAELLSLGLSGPLNQKQTDAVVRIRTNQQHLLALIDDVLSFARIEAGNTPFKPEPVTVCDALDSLEALLRPDLARQELTYVWNGCDASLMTRAEPIKLRQILLNVLGNATKFTLSISRDFARAMGGRHLCSERA